MKILLALLIFVSAGVSVAQTNKAFQLPPQARYAKGRVLVKIKSEFKDEFLQNSSARVKSLPFTAINSLVKPEVAKKNASFNGPRIAPPVVDIMRYFEIGFDPKKNIEDFINELYATGYFEIVEPSYVYSTSFTPNDPSVTKQYYLQTIKAYQAWDITQGSEDLTIAIVDSGGDLDHPDLSGNLYTNTKENPTNGIDDDGDGFIDNYHGWDFVGADTLNVAKTDFIGDNDPSVHSGGDISHGTWVAGCASASTNNGIGIAGVGNKTKIMFTKHSADNQKTTDGSVYFGYTGMLYAANQHIKIINCSWGGAGQSQVIQDIINHITFDLGSLVVAAAGNTGNSVPSYPGAYDNVLSVAATDANDKRASFTTYGTTVDIAAPGVGIYTTAFNDSYATVDGTSFSTPITSGAAALVWAKNPTFTPKQVAEQLRVTSDANALYTANPALKNMLGHGRLDIQRALTISLASIRASNPRLVNTSGTAVQPGEKGFLSFDFTNFLNTTSNGIELSVSVASSYVTVTKGAVFPGTIQTGQTISNDLTPFELTIASNVPENTSVNLLLTFFDGSYSDTQSIPLLINPSYINVNSNLINTTISAIGRIGYQDPSTSSEGVGFIFNQQSILYEMGLIMGTSPTVLYNNVRAADPAAAFDEDFTSLVKIKQLIPGTRADNEVFGEFSNSATVASQNVVVDYRSMAWKNAPDEKFIIMEYKIKNPTSVAINNFYFGIFADWDLTTNGALDAANVYPDKKLGYVYPATTSAKPFAGISVLTGAPLFYGIDNDQTIAGTPFGLYDGFSDTEKFTTISTQRTTAGQSTPDGNDVSQVVSSGPYNIAPGQVITAAFALHAAANLDDLKTSATYADSLYNFTLNAPRPVVDTVKVCYNSPATLHASGATKLKWYKTFSGGTAFFTGTQFTTGNLTSDTTFYVSNGEKFYESVRTPAVVILKANPKISSSAATTFCDNQSITLSVPAADSYAWSNGATTQAITVSAAGTFSVTVKDNTLSCQSSSLPVTTKVNPSPTAAFTSEGDVTVAQPITFTDQSSGAVSWFWDFGDNSNAADESPTHTYAKVNNYTASLTVTSANGCQNTITHAVSVVTGLPEDQETTVNVFPNPVSSGNLIVEFAEKAGTPVRLSLVNILSQPIYQDDFQAGEQRVHREIPAKTLPEGIYILRIKTGNRIVTRKIVKEQ